MDTSESKGLKVCIWVSSLREHGFWSWFLGDGDCFYRGDQGASFRRHIGIWSTLILDDSPAIGFAFLVQLLGSSDQEMAVMTTLSTLAATRQLLEETGVQELVYADFYDQTVQLVQKIIVPDEKKAVLTLDSLLEFFRDAQGKYDLER